MNRFNISRAVTKLSPRSFTAGKETMIQTIRNANTSVMLFAALLLACAMTVACSSDSAKPVSSNVQLPANQAPAPPAVTNLPAPVYKAEAKPTPKRVIRRRPATVTYDDASSGVQFEYPRRYALETGDAATSLVASTPLPMDFIQPGGTAIAAVELPESSYLNTDFSSGFFSVSLHKGLTADQCGEFSVPEKKPDATDSSDDGSPVFMLGDMEMKAAEAVAGEGARQSDSKYFHLFQNGACYEFALNVTTASPATDGQMKHVDRDQVFNRLEKIMATLKINAIAEPEQAAKTDDKPAETKSADSTEKPVVEAAPVAAETPVQDSKTAAVSQPVQPAAQPAVAPANSSSENKPQ